MTANRENAERERKAIDRAEEDLYADDGVYHSLEEFLGEDRMFFDELGEVVEA